MAVALFGIDEDTCLDLLSIARGKKLSITHDYDNAHARFEKIVERDSPEVEDWITTALIGWMMAEADGNPEELDTITLPGMYHQLPLDYLAPLIAWRGENGNLIVRIYRPTSREHLGLNQGIQSTRRQIITKCQNIQHASQEGACWGTRLDACNFLIDTLEAILRQEAAV